ncbi:MAG TPA: hypothetical protein PLB92_12775 [Rhodoglobus sp.]|nr:hypothetical protein [Rhodoglobus sp.]
MATEARTKGIGFLNVKAFVCERYGERSWNELIGILPPADRDEIAAVVTVGWYRLPLYARLIREIDRTHGRGDLALVEQIGSFEAERDLTTIHRMFLRMANPAFIVEQVGKYWARFNDTGDWEVKRIDSRSATAILRNWGVVDSALCRENVGYIRRALELVGARDVIVDHKRCRCSGAGECVYEGKWR